MNVSEKIRYRDLKDRRISTITIHNGRFHADDVFCAALCQIINPKIQIIRTRDLNEFKGLCCDVGGGRYDHHPINGEDKEKRKKAQQLCYEKLESEFTWKHTADRLEKIVNSK